jgi:hypothetical protein
MQNAELPMQLAMPAKQWGERVTPLVPLLPV